jgi:hypothetical protein
MPVDWFSSLLGEGVIALGIVAVVALVVIRTTRRPPHD